MKVLAVVCQVNHCHIDYLAALREQCELHTAYSCEAQAGAVDQARREGFDMVSLGMVSRRGLTAVRQALATEVEGVRPDVVHVMYYFHEELTILARDVFVGPIIFECRDPLTTLAAAPPSAPRSPLEKMSAVLEKRALQVSDAHILVSRALQTYLETRHHLTLPSTLIVPHGFSHTSVGPPQPKLSATDGHTHIALVGTADASPRHGRYYVDIIHRLVSLGFVVHSHFHDIDGQGNPLYRALSESLTDYHYHPAVPHRHGLELSNLTSRYDLMGVFHELLAPEGNEAATLTVCMPTKAVSGWVHGGIPIVCFRHYSGLVERVQELGIGFVLDSWDDLAPLAVDRTAIVAATERVLQVRNQFTYRVQAERVADFYRSCWPEDRASVRHPVTPVSHQHR